MGFVVLHMEKAHGSDSGTTAHIERFIIPKNTVLHREVADHEEPIEALQDRIQNMQADHSRQMAEVERKHRREIADKETKHKEEISFLKTVIARAAAWFPYFREMLRIENLCRLVGFDERQTATLVKGKPLEYAGVLYSEEHGKGWVSSSERPHGRDEISSCHRPKTHCRVVQGTVREVKAEHTPTYTTAKERQGNLSGNR